MGKTRIIAETGAGQHGVATATVCARFGLQCVVYMGATDVERQKPNVFRMKLLGAEVVPVTSRARGTLKDAMNEALRDWVTNVDDTFYCIGTVAGPHPYPAMVRDFQSVIGKETRAQMLEREGRLPDTPGRLHRRRLERDGPVPPVPRRPERAMIGVEAAGHGIDERHSTPPSLTGGRPGVLHGNRTYLLQDDDGQIIEAPLDLGRPRLSRHRPGARLAARHRPGRVLSASPTTRRSRPSSSAASSKASSRRWSRRMPWPQSCKLAPTLPADHLMVMNLCGRGDKDIFTVAEHLGRSSRVTTDDPPASALFAELKARTAPPS